MNPAKTARCPEGNTRKRHVSAARGSIIKTLPLLELDVLVERTRLNSDPGSALDQTKAIARAVRIAAPPPRRPATRRQPADEGAIDGDAALPHRQR